MAWDKKISALTAWTPLDTDIIPYVDLVTGETKKALKSELEGADWNGIDNIALINTVWLVKTYRITFTDASTFDYDVTDWTDWIDWTNGTNWTNGTDWNWIDNIALISTVGLVKTYRITYTDATTFDYTVTDWADWISGTWDVNWPASAVDNNIATYDTTTGKLIQDWGSSIAQVKDRANHTGTQTADTIIDGSTNAILTLDEKKALISGLSSWLRTWGIITQNLTNPNNIDITAGQGIVIDNTDPINPIYTKVVWTAQTDVVLTNIATQPVTNLYFDKTGTLQQWTLANINNTRRQNVLIGVIEHIFSPNIESVDNISAQPYDTYVNLDELSSTLGRIKSVTFSTTWLNINLSAGTTFGVGDNKDSSNPNFKSYTAQSWVTFTPTYRDGVWGWVYWTSGTTIPTTQYDNGTGTLATLSKNNRATVHLLFWNPLSNAFFLQYWQNQYNNIDVAKSKYLADTQEINPLLWNVIFLWAIGLNKVATSVWFIQNSDKIGQLGIGWGSWPSATDLQSSYNVSLPSAEIETNVTNWAVSLKWGTGTDTDNVLEIKNNAWTVTASISWNWNIVASSANILGGWIDNTVIGSIVPAAGTFTTVNGVALTNGGLATNFLQEDGNYWPVASWASAATQSTITIGEDVTAWDAIVYKSPNFLKSDALDSTLVNFVWFANETITSGNPLVVNTAWVDNNQSGLTIWSDYYLDVVRQWFNISSPISQWSKNTWWTFTIYWNAISSDWLNYYICDYSWDTVYQYPLSTAFDITTAWTSLWSVNIWDNFAAGIFLSPDWTELYIASGSANTIRQYTLSTPFSITTATFTNSISSGSTWTQWVCLNTDGTKMYVSTAGSNTIRWFTLSVAYDVSSAIFDNDLDVSTQTTEACSCYIDNDWTKMFLTGISNTNVYQYDLSTPYDISTWVFSTSFSITLTWWGMTFWDNWSRIYKATESTKTTYQYDTFAILSTPWAITSSPYETYIKVWKAISATEIEIYTGGKGDNVDISQVNNLQTSLDWKLSTTGTAADSTKVWGITITGTPTVWQVPTATSGTAATWQDAWGGGWVSEIFSAWKTVNQGLTWSLVTVVFNSEKVDTWANYNNTTWIYTAPSAWEYQFNAMISFESLSSWWIVEFVMYKWATKIAEYLKSGDGNQYDIISMQHVITLATSDTVLIKVSRASWTWWTVQWSITRTKFSGFKMN